VKKRFGGFQALSDVGVQIKSGQIYTPTAVYLVERAGIARTLQNIRLFGGMTILENVRVGCLIPVIAHQSTHEMAPITLLTTRS
jgi:branched-chain amino acid transport system ATP-binding protein